MKEMDGDRFVSIRDHSSVLKDRSIGLMNQLGYGGLHGDPDFSDCIQFTMKKTKTAFQSGTARNELEPHRPSSRRQACRMMHFDSSPSSDAAHSIF